MISTELREIYTQNISIQSYDTIELYHPLFSKTYYMVRSNTPITKDVNGTLTDFEPYGFTVVPPKKGSDDQSLAFMFDNTSGMSTRELENASYDTDTPITLTYRVYIDGQDDPQITPIVLNLTNISATTNSVTANANRVNLYGRKVPNIAYDPWRFKGVNT